MRTAAAFEMFIDDLRPKQLADFRLLIKRPMHQIQLLYEIAPLEDRQFLEAAIFIRRIKDALNES